MRRRENEPYNYEQPRNTSQERQIRTRRNLNMQINVGNLDSGITSAEKPTKNRGSSNDRSDYNIDESESEEGPTINKNSSVFNPPINEKKNRINSIDYQNNDRLIGGKPLGGLENDLNEVSPINARNKFRRNDGMRTSDLEDFQTPLNTGMSPIGMSSTQARLRNREFRQNQDLNLDRESSDEPSIMDSDDLYRGRPRDASPHNRFARPRSSCIKKDWTKERQNSELSSPKQVRFQEVVKNKFDQEVLDSKLNKEVNFKHDENATSATSARTRVRMADNDEYVKEISRQELESRFGGKGNNPTDTYMGGNLRSNERLNPHEQDYIRDSDPYGDDYTRKEVAKPNAIEQAFNNSHINNNRTTPPRTFQMKNIVNNTEYTRKRLPENKEVINTTIAEMPSKYEESREENSYMQRVESKGFQNQPRSRSPFNVSQAQNTSYVKENVQARSARNPVGYSAGSNREYYEIDDGTTTVLQQKPDPYNYNMPRRQHSFDNEPKMLPTKPAEPMHSTFPQRDYPVRDQEQVYRNPEYDYGPRKEIAYPPWNHRDSSPMRYNNEPQRSQRDFAQRAPRDHSPLVHREPAPMNRIEEQPRMQREPVPRAGREEYPRHQSPRERPMESPRHGEARRRDSDMELNVLSRFISNNMLNKTIEDLVFELVPQFYDEFLYPPQQVVHRKEPVSTGRDIKPPKVAQREPSFDFERKGNQSRKEAIKSHNQELMNAVKRMDMQEDEVSSDSDDVDEKSRVNPIIASMEKKETNNYYVQRRAVDSLGIRFETNKRVDGVKAVPYHEKHNYPMVDVSSRVTRKTHEICDVW